MHAKLINNQLVPFTVGETLLIGDRLITNPSIEAIETIGYKEVIYHDGNNGMYYEDNYLIVETPIPIPAPVLTPEEQREIAYANELIIEWDGKLRTCDFIRGLVRTYELLSDTAKVEQLIVLWLAGREAIQSKYPD